MASSDLLIQSLLGGQQAMDPAVAAFQPRMSLAQSMLQQGTDASPTTKWGGLSRLAAALTGGLLLNQNQEGLQGIADQRARDAASFGASLGDTLAPPSAPAQQSGANQPGMNLAPSGNLSGVVHRLESGGSMAPGITGDGGAAGGPMQVHQAALTDVNRAQGTNYTLQQITADPNLGMKVGDAYLSQQQARFPGRPDLALAAYNAGPTATANAGGPGVAGVPPSAQGYVDKGMAQVAGPGAPQAAQQPPQVGADNPYVAKALDTIHRAQAAMIANPYNPQIQKAGQMAIDNAHTMLGMDTYRTNADGTQTNLRTNQNTNAAAPNSHYVQTSTGSHDTTGLKPDTYMPAPRPFTDTHGNTGAVGPGGSVTPVASNPSGITGNTPESNSMRIMAEVGPKIIAGTATDQEKASYATAATTYQGYKTQASPVTKNIEQVPSQPLPPGMPNPAGAPSGVIPLTNGNVRGAENQQSVNANQADIDTKLAAEEQAKALEGHTLLGTTSTIRSQLPNVTTGKGADARLVTSQVASALGMSPEKAQSYFGTNPVSGELLQKKLFELSTGAVRGMGAREPGMVVQMFAKNYPNMNSQNMTIDSMTRLLDMDQTYKEDASAGKRDYLNQSLSQGAQAGSDGAYRGLSGYTPPDPKVYQSAALASGGMPFADWSKGLTPQEQTAALKLTARAYPDAAVLDSKGVKHTFQPAPNGN